MNNKNIKSAQIFWVVFTILYIANFIWLAWLGRDSNMVVWNVFLGCITSTGLIFYSFNEQFISQLFWKIYFGIEVLFISFALVTFFIMMSLMSSNQVDEGMTFQPVEMLFGLTIHFTALYGLWRYAYKSPSLWSRG
jgi:hypothetical protein